MIIGIEAVALVALIALLVVVIRDDPDSSDTATTTTLAGSTTTSSNTTVAPTTQESTTSTTQPATTTTTQPPTTSTTTAPTTVPRGVAIEVIYADGAVSSVVRNGVDVDDDRVPVPVDDPVLLVVEADAKDEVHVHGYDLFADVAPGDPAQIEFVADVPGIFEVELERGHDLLIELVIS